MRLPALVAGVAAALPLLVCAPATDAAVIVYAAALDGPSEPPPNNTSAGAGSVTLTYDDIAYTLRVQASFTGLAGTTTAAHIHCCTPAPGAGTAGVASMVPSFVGFPLGVTAGTYDNTFDLSDPGGAGFFNPAFLTANSGSVASARAALLSGMDSAQAYFNIHTSTFPGGDIRGFLQRQSVPEPGTALLLALGASTLALGARSSRSRARRRGA